MREKREKKLGMNLKSTEALQAFVAPGTLSGLREKEARLSFGLYW